MIFHRVVSACISLLEGFQQAAMYMVARAPAGSSSYIHRDSEVCGRSNARMLLIICS